MTSTVEIIKVLLEDKLALKILRAINIKNCTFEEVCELMDLYSEKEVKRAVIYLDKISLINNVFTRSGDFYRISARGARILEIAEEAVIEEKVSD